MFIDFSNRKLQDIEISQDQQADQNFIETGLRSLDLKRRIFLLSSLTLFQIVYYSVY